MRTQTRKKLLRRSPPRQPATDRKKPKRADPAPTDADVDPDVLEFIAAIGRYRLERSRPFPNWSEILEILKALGYRKPSAPVVQPQQ
jgi:hypothetical protein